MSLSNLLTAIPANLPAELTETLLVAGKLRIERIVSQGQASPPDFWYDQDQPEWVLLVQGASRLQLGDQLLDMRPGDFVNIPAHQPHRVEWTAPDEPTIWLAIFYE